MLYCSFCRYPDQDLRRLKSDTTKKGYILSCKSCELKRGLEDVPTYESSQLLEFYEQRRLDPISPTIIEAGDGSKYIQFHNGRLELLNRKELKIMAEEIHKTLSLDHTFDEFIENRNHIIHLEESYSSSKEDKFQIPYHRLRLSKKYFNSDKNKWSFRCGNCSDLINIDVQEGYYTIIPGKVFLADNERGCSKGCTKVMVKNIIQTWLHTSELTTYFYVEDLDKEITDLIENA